MHFPARMATVTHVHMQTRTHGARSGADHVLMTQTLCEKASWWVTTCVWLFSFRVSVCVCRCVDSFMCVCVQQDRVLIGKSPTSEVFKNKIKKKMVYWSACSDQQSMMGTVTGTSQDSMTTADLLPRRMTETVQQKQTISGVWSRKLWPELF